MGTASFLGQFKKSILSNGPGNVQYLNSLIVSRNKGRVYGRSGICFQKRKQKHVRVCTVGALIMRPF